MGGKLRMEITKAPVLFIVFNRPEVTQQVFKKLIENPFISKIYVSCDGPRPCGRDDQKVKAVKNIISRAQSDIQILTNYSNENQGCKMGVKNAIDWFFKNEEAGIIIEDDCLPSVSFIPYCAMLLEKYRLADDIFAIDGSNYSDITSHTDSYAFSKYTMIWGWATWRNRWEKMDLKMKNIDLFYSGKFREKFKGINERIYWKNNLNAALENNIDTWDFQWMYSIWKNDGKIIAPKVNMIKNIGFGEDATHSKTSNHIFEVSNCNEIDFPLIHPEARLFDHDLDRRLSKNRFNIRFRSNIRRLIKRYLKV